ncbi:MAG: ATP binding [Chaenotheca gracillima]|nr:MAG: ATP binding [Chaenotheca gracillima]
MSERVFHYWADGVQAKDIVGYGTSGYAARLPNTDEVIKVPSPADEGARLRCAREIEVYERLETGRDPRPDSILQYRGVRSDGALRLEYAAGGNFKQHLVQSRETIQPDEMLRWAKQGAQALAYCHANSVLHGDICGNNFMLDGDMNLKLGDFAGSAIDQLPALVAYHTTHQLPGIEMSSPDGDMMITIESEIFAFGSLLYEIMNDLHPYASLSENEVERRYLRKEFPDTSQFGALGPIIAGCWALQFETMEDVVKSIESRSRQYHRMQALAVSFTCLLVVHVFHNIIR